jgi:hypothetical protein
MLLVTLALCLAGCSLLDDAPFKRHSSAPHPARPGTVIGAVVWKPIAGETVEQAEQLASLTCAEYGLQAETGVRNDKGATAELRYSCQ